VVEALQAQSMTFYLVEGNDITFKHIYYSPTLWGKDKAKETKFQETKSKLLTLKLPLGTGNVGKVIKSGDPLFFTNNGPEAESLMSMAKTTGFEVSSMLTVALKTNIVIGAIQVLNKEPAAGTDGQFTDKDLTLLQEVAEYSSTLIQRMVDPKFELGPDDTARFIAKLTDLPLVTTIEEIEIDEKLVEVTGDAIMRREGIFPHKQTTPNSVCVLMTTRLITPNGNPSRRRLTCTSTRCMSFPPLFSNPCSRNSSRRPRRPAPDPTMWISAPSPM